MTDDRTRDRSTTLLVARPRLACAVIFVLLLAPAAQPLVTLRAQWWGWFPATMGVFIGCTVWGSVVVCAAAAWLAGGLRRYDLAEWASASVRGTRGAYQRPLLLCGTLGAVAYTVGFLVMIIATLAATLEPVAELPTTLLLVLPLSWASAFAWSAVGVALARLVRMEAALALAVILSYSAYVVPVYYFFQTPY